MRTFMQTELNPRVSAMYTMVMALGLPTENLIVMHQFYGFYIIKTVKAEELDTLEQCLSGSDYDNTINEGAHLVKDQLEKMGFDVSEWPKTPEMTAEIDEALHEDAEFCKIMADYALKRVEKGDEIARQLLGNSFLSLTQLSAALDIGRSASYTALGISRKTNADDKPEAEPAPVTE